MPVKPLMCIMVYYKPVFEAYQLAFLLNITVAALLLRDRVLPLWWEYICVEGMRGKVEEESPLGKYVKVLRKTREKRKKLLEKVCVFFLPRFWDAFSFSFVEC